MSLENRGAVLSDPKISGANAVDSNSNGAETRASRRSHREGFLRRHKLLASLTTIGAALLALKGSGVLSTDKARDPDPPRFTITRIDSIDIGCFVRVTSQAHGAVHERNRVNAKIKGVGVSWTTWTDTTEKDAKGESKLCADNAFTTVERIDDRLKKIAPRLRVTIGRLYPEGHIDHDGNDAAQYNPSFGSRVGTFGFPDNSNAEAGLDAILQWGITKTACIKPAVRVAKAGIQKHYDDIARSIAPDITVLPIIYPQTAIPVSESVPQGRADAALTRAGWAIPSNWDFDLAPIGCDAVLIDGQLEVPKPVLPAAKGGK